MRALLYLLTLTFGCFLKNGYCVINFDDFISNKDAMFLVARYYNDHGIRTQLDLLKELNNIGLEMVISTLNKYLKEIEKEAGGGSRKKAFERFKNNPRAMNLVKQFNNNKITDTELLEALQQLNPRMSIRWMHLYLARLNEEQDADGGTLNLQAHQIAQQSSNFTSGNPGSSTSASNKGKSTNFGGGSRKITFQRFKDDPSVMNLVKKFNNHEIADTVLFEELKQINPKMNIKSMYLYLARLNQEQKAGGTSYLPNQSQSTELGDFSNPVPPFPQVPQIAQQSSNFTSGNPGSSTSASEKGKSTKFSKESNPDNWSLSSITGYVSSLFGASPQEPQFPASMHNTSAASSYYPSNQPDDQTLQSMITPRNQQASHYGSAMSYQQVPPVQDTFVSSQAGTDSTNFGGNWQNNDGYLESMIRKSSSSGGFDGTPFLPNQSQSTRRTGASNYFSPTPNTSNFTSGNPGSSSYYGSAMPFQQVPMPGTSFPSFPNYLSNQSAPLNSSTNFVPYQPGTPSLDWSGGNSQNNDEDLYSMVRPKSLSSEKKGKKPKK